MVARRVDILGVPVDPVTTGETLDLIDNFIASKLPHQIATVNPEFIMAAQKNAAFFNVLKSSNLNIADGIGILTAASFLALPKPRWRPLRVIVGALQGLAVGITLPIHFKIAPQPLPAAVTGIDLITAIARRGSQTNWRLYLLGGRPGIARAAAQTLSKQFPRLTIVGAEEGIPFNSSPQDIEPLIQRIHDSTADVLFVAFGAPKQDLFIANYKNALNIPVMVGVGGAFDFLAGTSRRAPHWLRWLGLEWLWRLALEPWRLPRIITATIRFPWEVYRSMIAKSA